MSQHSVVAGKRYRAHVHLGFGESLLVSDEEIREGLIAKGFSDVYVVGEGRERWAFGTATASQTYDAPSEVVDVVEIG